MKMYYFFNDYGNCTDEKEFNSEEEAAEYCNQHNYEYFCCD